MSFFYKTKFALVIWLISNTLNLNAQTIDLIPFFKNGVWGYCDTSLKVKINPQFELACPFDPNGFAIIYKKQIYPDTLKGNVSQIGNFNGNTPNEIIINPVYRCNIIDKTGKILLNEWFDQIIERGESYTLINYKRSLYKDTKIENLSYNGIDLSGRESIKNSWLIDKDCNLLRKSDGINYLIENNLIVNDLKNNQTIFNLKGDTLYQTTNFKLIGFNKYEYLAFNDTAYFKLNHQFKIIDVFSRSVSKSLFNKTTSFLFPFNKSLENYPVNEFIGFKFEKYDVDPVRKDNWHYLKSEINFVNEMGDEFSEHNYGFIDSTGLKFLELNQNEKKRFSYGYSSIKGSFCGLCYENFIDKNGKLITFINGIGNQNIMKFSPYKNFIGSFKYGFIFYYSAKLDNPESGDYSTLSEEFGFMNIRGKKYKIN